MMAKAKRSGVRRSRGDMAIELVALIVFVAACSGGPKAPGRAAWSRARTIAETYLRQKYGAPPAWHIEGEHEGAPFLFDVSSPEQALLLVHRDQVVEQKGLAGLDRYLRESRCAELRTAKLDDMMSLLFLFQALPPAENSLGYVRRDAKQTAFRPRLDFHDGGSATLHLFYIVEQNDEAPGEGEHDEVWLIEWTLTMDPGQMPVWRQRPRTWNKAAQTFIDEQQHN